MINQKAIALGGLRLRPQNQAVANYDSLGDRKIIILTFHLKFELMAVTTANQKETETDSNNTFQTSFNL